MNELENTISQVIEENYIPFEWNEKIDNELADIKLNKNLPRKDLTRVPFITIDGADAKDFDDALSIEKEGGFYNIGIHIAGDVISRFIGGVYVDKWNI